MKFMVNILILIMLAYAMLCGLIYVLQDRMIFLPTSPVDSVYKATQKNEIIFGSQGHEHHGWKINLNSNSKKTIIYFGGNAEDVVYLNYEAENYHAKQIIAFNYPGYGKSQGKASEESFYQSALDVYDHVMETYQLQAEDIIIIGRSIGSSVAAYLGANRNISALILITPFDSVENVAVQHYRFFPVKLLLKHKFLTTDYIVKIKKPILILIAENDEIISKKHSQNLQVISGEQNHIVELSGVGHNTIQSHNDFYNEMNRFINDID